MSSAVRTCPRCGIRRQVHESRTGELCRDCKKVDPDWPNVRWVVFERHRHGSSRYDNHGCRCEECKEGHREKQHRERRARRARLAADPSLAPHGRRSTYSNWGCRCDECKAAQSAYLKRRYEISAQRKAS